MGIAMIFYFSTYHFMHPGFEKDRVFFQHKISRNGWANHLQGRLWMVIWEHNLEFGDKDMCAMVHPQRLDSFRRYAIKY